MSKAGRVGSPLIALLAALSFWSSPPATAEPTPPQPATGDEQPVVAGALMEKRKALSERIKTAARDGIGTGAYMAAFRGVEDMVKAGAPESKVQERIEAIHRGLDDQIKRAQILKTQRPAPPVQLSGGGSTQAAGKDPLAELKASGGGDKLLDKLKEKFGDRIPADLDTDALKKRLLEDDRAKELLKKLGH